MCPKKLSKLLILIIELLLFVVVGAACGINGLKSRIVEHTINERNFTLPIFKEVYNFIKHVASHRGK